MDISCLDPYFSMVVHPRMLVGELITNVKKAIHVGSGD